MISIRFWSIPVVMFLILFCLPSSVVNAGNIVEINDVATSRLPIGVNPIATAGLVLLFSFTVSRVIETKRNDYLDYNHSAKDSSVKKLPPPYKKHNQESSQQPNQHPNQQPNQQSNQQPNLHHNRSKQPIKTQSQSNCLITMDVAQQNQESLMHEVTLEQFYNLMPEIYSCIDSTKSSNKPILIIKENVNSFEKTA